MPEEIIRKGIPTWTPETSPLAGGGGVIQRALDVIGDRLEILDVAIDLPFVSLPDFEAQILGGDVEGYTWRRQDGGSPADGLTQGNVPGVPRLYETPSYTPDRWPEFKLQRKYVQYGRMSAAAYDFNMAEIAKIIYDLTEEQGGFTIVIAEDIAASFDQPERILWDGTSRAIPFCLRGERPDIIVANPDGTRPALDLRIPTSGDLGTQLPHFAASVVIRDLCFSSLGPNCIWATWRGEELIFDNVTVTNCQVKVGTGYDITGYAVRISESYGTWLGKLRLKFNQMGGLHMSNCNMVRWGHIISRGNMGPGVRMLNNIGLSGMITAESNGGYNGEIDALYSSDIHLYGEGPGWKMTQTSTHDKSNYLITKSLDTKFSGFAQEATNFECETDVMTRAMCTFNGAKKYTKQLDLMAMENYQTVQAPLELGWTVSPTITVLAPRRVRLTFSNYANGGNAWVDIAPAFAFLHPQAFAVGDTLYGEVIIKGDANVLAAATARTPLKGLAGGLSGYAGANVAESAFNVGIYYRGSSISDGTVRVRFVARCSQAGSSARVFFVPSLAPGTRSPAHVWEVELEKLVLYY